MKHRYLPSVRPHHSPQQRPSLALELTLSHIQVRVFFLVLPLAVWRIPEVRRDYPSWSVAGLRLPVWWASSWGHTLNVLPLCLGKELSLFPNTSLNISAERILQNMAHSLGENHQTSTMKGVAILSCTTATRGPRLSWWQKTNGVPSRWDTARKLLAHLASCSQLKEYMK